MSNISLLLENNSKEQTELNFLNDLPKYKIWQPREDFSKEFIANCALSEHQDNGNISTCNKCPRSRADDEEAETSQAEELIAKKFFESGKKMWLEAWKAEENGLAKASSDNFEKANQSFEKALQLDADNVEYKKFASISSIKIEGNKLFNEAVKIQQEANEFKMKHLFQEARLKFQEASAKFHEGFEESDNDPAFKDCETFIEISVNNINLVIRKLQLSIGIEKFDFN